MRRAPKAIAGLRERSRWDGIAAAFPYYAVLTEPRYLGALGTEARRAFFDTGESDVDSLVTRIAGFTGGTSFRTVLEFGCGPGRLVCAFARRGFAVTAVDISPKMLELARRNAEERDCSGVTFLSLEEFAASDTLYDLVNATLVLQQIEPATGCEIIRELLARAAPGGFVHLQIPYRTDRHARSRAMLAMRKRVPALNRAVNALRKRPADAPVITPFIYSLDEVFHVFREAEMDVRAVDLGRENELEVATIVARRRIEEKAEAVAAPAAVEEIAAPAEFIDVRELMRSISIDELHRRAEEYFATAPSLDAQLAKPFANPAEASPMLINLGVLLSGMRLVQGHTVLDFGAGTGWLSRSLAQMGCRMIVMDVSPTALRVAEEHFGEVAHRPRFVLFDGYSIDLPDESVDRIVCFDAFHHVPNPDRVLRELGRVLKPGGLAAFSEPGPHHSKSALSQFEMRTYGVLENDVDIHAIWEVARESGFVDLHLAAFSGTPPRIRLEQFDELLRGGDALLDAADEMRKFLQNVRIFYLQKAGTEEVDSRTISALACRIEATLGSVRSGEPITVTATVVNTGSATWLRADTKPGGVSLGCHLYSRGALVQFDHHWQGLADRAIAPGEEVRVEFQLPPLPPGEYDLEFDCVANEVTWFAQVGSTPCRLSGIRVP